jgi:hypothetical protein
MELVDVRGAVDLHVHSFPCIFPRLADDRAVVRAACEAGMRAIVLKSHHESTVSRAYLLKDEFPEIQIFGGVVLNHFVGGINPAAAEVGLRLGAREVWMPTIDSDHHVTVHGGREKYDVQEGEDSFAWGDPIRILDENGKLTAATIVVLELIAQHNAILGTAHLSLEEITPLVKEARLRGVQKILLTHPYFRVPAGMNEQFLLEMAAQGVIAEFGFCTVSPMWAYATVEQTKHAMDTIGYQNCVIMSDAGQTHNPIAPEAMRLYAQCLYEKGVKASELELLMAKTPSALLGID